MQLYQLIELRAKVRAADDTLALSADEMRRIINTIQMGVLDRQLGLDEDERKHMARHAGRLLEFYLERVVSPQRRLHDQFELFMERAGELVRAMGGRKRFLQFVDKTIDVEALDIDLSQAAHTLELPPTINKQMIRQSEVKWAPRLLLDLVDADRRVLMMQPALMKRLLFIDQRWAEEDVADWTLQVSRQVCGLAI